jgi:sulfur-oxidizing protein SoxX
MKPIKLALVPASLIALAVTAWAGDVEPKDVAYADGAVAASLTGVAGDAAAGQKVMVTRGLGNCIACHAVSTLSDYPFHGEIGPSLDGAGDRWSEAELRGIVADSKMTFDDSMMPSFYKKSGYIRPGKAYTGKKADAADLDTLLSAQQIEDVVAYLLTLKE